MYYAVLSPIREDRATLRCEAAGDLAWRLGRRINSRCPVPNGALNSYGPKRVPGPF
jgi:hypothetical protein